MDGTNLRSSNDRWKFVGCLAGCGGMSTRRGQSGPREGLSEAIGCSKVVYELGQDTSGYSKQELREIIDGLVWRIRKLERELERSGKRGSQAGKRRGQRPRSKGGAGEVAYRKPPDEGRVTDEQDVLAQGGCPHCGDQLEHDGWQDAWVSDITQELACDILYECGQFK